MTDEPNSSAERYDPAVLQYKFQTREPAEPTLSKIYSLLELMEFQCEASREEELLDEYFDDKSRTLFKNDCFIRVRSVPGGTKILTIAAHKKHAASIAAERMKVETTSEGDGFESLIQAGFRDELSRIYREKFRIPISCTTVAKAVGVRNRRTSIPFATSAGRYILTMDRYWFRNDEVESEEQTEVEITGESKLALHDDGLQKLSKALQELLELVPDKTTKFRRAIKWSRDEGKQATTVHCVMFDIVGYSKSTSDVQRKSIVAFGQIVQEAIVEVGTYDIDEILFIPTGDGLILTMEQDPRSLIKVVFEVQDSVRAYCAEFPEFAFTFRTGLHSGPVFKYQDINSKTNYAGNGINLAQRVMNAGNEGHILCTREMFENVAGMDAAAKHFFHELPAERVIKHGGSLKLYNVYDDQGHGNSALPAGGDWI